LTFWFWVTPIFFSEKRLPKTAKALVALNPLAPVVRSYREMLLGGRSPHAGELVIAGVWGIVVFLVGGLFFRHMKRGFADVL